MNGKKILVVDDDPMVRVFLNQSLSFASFEVVEASGGLQGLKLAQELELDLVLLDVRMPDLDGTEVLHRLRSQEATKHLPTARQNGPVGYRSLPCG